MVKQEGKNFQKVVINNSDIYDTETILNLGFKIHIQYDPLNFFLAAKRTPQERKLAYLKMNETKALKKDAAKFHGTQLG